ncbi:hypothetical protein AB0C27_55045 [Nonomuraea sp. NPDC048882]|uniref:hypothetical protein n=1 Tax=Nonomuraea sp. NPDC048882 TaxID=3154347 RepID=UPI0033C88461
MNKIGKCAAVLAMTVSGALVAGGGSPALADPHPVFDAIDDIVPDAGFLPNLSKAASMLCTPGARNFNVKSDGGRIPIRRIDNCALGAQQNSAPPPDGGPRSETVVEMQDCAAGDRMCAATARCPRGRSATDGGFRLIPGGSRGWTATENHAVNDDAGSGWFVEVTDIPDDLVFLQVYAVCAYATP